MRKFFLLLTIFPILSFAQSKNTSSNSKTKTRTTHQAKTVSADLPDADHFLISGTISGLPDGTVIALLNGNSGAQEASSILANGAFKFSGAAAVPDFKLISVNMQPPYITLFIDNSNVKIKAKKDSLQAAVITGSASQKDFESFTKISSPYSGIFTGEMEPNENLIQEGNIAFNSFISSHPNAYITPLAVIRNYQLTGNEMQLDEQFHAMKPLLQQTEVGQYVANQVAENAKHPIGKPLANFTQSDTAGLPVQLSSLKGKYVLVDFWASWCRPCRMENPNVVSAYNQYKDKNFTVLGISLDQAKPAWLDAIKMDNLTWTQVSDLKGWGNAVAAQFDIRSIPQNFLLDPNGVLIGKNLRGSALTKKLESIMK